MTLMSIDHARHPAGDSPRWLHRLLISAVGLLALTGSAFAGQLNLAWDGVSAAAGYRVYYGAASSAYTASQDVGNKTSAAVSGLTEGKEYFFAVQAYAGTATSGYSNEVSAVVPTTTTATAPVASFTASSLNVTTNQSVTLVDTSTGGTVASRSWSLGAGASVTAPTALAAATVVTSYTSTGPKTVTLNVTGANGVKSSASKTINVTATAAPPVASFSATPTSGTAPLKVAFTDASSGSITGWSWSFGPTGATSTAQNPSYTYASPGTYTVSHTVTGPGGSSTKTSSITVSAPRHQRRFHGLIQRQHHRLGGGLRVRGDERHRGDGFLRKRKQRHPLECHARHPGEVRAGPVVQREQQPGHSGRQRLA